MPGTKDIETPEHPITERIQDLSGIEVKSMTFPIILFWVQSLLIYLLAL